MGHLENNGPLSYTDPPMVDRYNYILSKDGIHQYHHLDSIRKVCRCWEAVKLNVVD